MTGLLRQVGLRDLCPNAGTIRLALANRLYAEGVNAAILRCLWAYAQECDRRGSPARLFAHWLGLPSRTLAKIDEMRGKNAWLARRLATDAAAPMEREGRLLAMPPRWVAEN